MARTRIGDVLRRAREKKGMKAEEVAALCNVTRGQYYQWEGAERILKKNIPLLAKALDKSESYLTRVNNGHVRERTDSETDPQAVSA